MPGQDRWTKCHIYALHLEHKLDGYISLWGGEGGWVETIGRYSILIYLSRFQKYRFRNCADVTCYCSESYCWKYVGIVALSWVERLVVNGHRTEWTSTGKHTLALLQNEVQDKYKINALWYNVKVWATKFQQLCPRTVDISFFSSTSHYETHVVTSDMINVWPKESEN